MWTGSGALLVLAGCASSPNRGASYGDQDTHGTGSGHGAESAPQDPKLESCTGVQQSKTLRAHSGLAESARSRQKPSELFAEPLLCIADAGAGAGLLAQEGQAHEGRAIE